MSNSPLPSTMKAFVVHVPPDDDDDDDDEKKSGSGSGNSNNGNNNPLDNGTLRTDFPVPTIPSPSYALIKVLRAGICNTDLEILRGYMGFAGVLGHEFVGIVAAVHDDASEDVRDEWLGRRVCGDINLGCCNDKSDEYVNGNEYVEKNENAATSSSSSSRYCGVCDDSLGYDRRHSQMSRNHCPNRTVLGILNRDGTFAEYTLLPIRNLHRVPESVPDEIAVFAEPLAAACRVVEQGLVRFRYRYYGDGSDDDGAAATASRGGDRVAILGDGKLGLCVAEILGREFLRCSKKKDREGGQRKTPPPSPILFGKHEHKLDLVRESGVRTMLVSSCYVDDERKQISPQHMNRYDVVVDATGNPDGLSLAMSLCRPMGTLVLKSTCATGVKGFHSAPVVIDELAVVGSRCGPIDVALGLLEGDFVEEKEEEKEASGEGDVVIPPLRMEKYVTKTFPLSRAREALECAALKSTMKVQLVMSEE